MIHLYWRSCRIAACVGGKYHRSRRRAWSHGERLDTEDAYEIPHPDAAGIGLDIALIPRQSERCLGYLYDEKVKAGFRRQSGYFNVEILSGAVRRDGHPTGSSRRATGR